MGDISVIPLIEEGADSSACLLDLDDVARRRWMP